MKKIIRLNESDLIKLVSKIINENMFVDKVGKLHGYEDYEDLTGEIEHGDLVQFKKYGTVYIVSIMDDGYLVSDDENQRFMDSDGDGHIIPLSAAKNAIMVEKADESDIENMY